MKFFSRLMGNLTFLTILILTLSLKNNLEAKDFKSKFNFEFQLTDNYQIINNTNLYQVYNLSHDDPKIKQQIDMFSQRLKEQDVEILFNFKQSLLDNISILAFKGAYKVDEKRVVKQCKKILKVEKKFGKRNVDIIECRMHDYPKFADWSMYRENESSYFEGVTTQQIIFMFNKTEFVITVACIEKCDKTKDDLFSLVKSIKF